MFSDIHPEFEALQIELLRSAPPWRKLDMVWHLNTAVQTLALCGLRARYPDELPGKIRLRLADILLCPNLAVKVYGRFEEVENADSTRCDALV